MWTPEPGVIADWVPVVYVTLMSSSSIKEINALILLYLGYPPEGLARTTTTRVLHALRMHGVRVVILDDAHMLRSTSVQGRAVLDYIKFLNTELGEVHNGTVILVGANLPNTAILDDPQIRARLTTMTVGAFEISTVEHKAAWQDLLATAADRPMQHVPDAAPDLFVTTLAQHIWRRTQGFVGEVAKLVAGSVLDAVHDRRSIITHDDLQVLHVGAPVPVPRRARDPIAGPDPNPQQRPLVRGRRLGRTRRPGARECLGPATRARVAATHA